MGWGWCCAGREEGGAWEGKAGASGGVGAAAVRRRRRGGCGGGAAVGSGGADMAHDGVRRAKGAGRSGGGGEV